MALKFQMTQMNNPLNRTEKLWYGTVRHEQPTMSLDDLAEHMADHNTPYSKGTIVGILTDMVSCIKEKTLEGRKVKIDNLAIFALQVKSKGEKDPKLWTVAKNVTNVHLSSRATGKFSVANLRAASLVESPDYTSPRRTEDEGTGGDTTPDENTEW